MNRNIRLRRIFAFTLDWWLAGLPCLLYILAFWSVFERPSIQHLGYMLVWMLLVLLFPVTFVLRDFIFKGRSIGKRIFGLQVLDKTTNLPASRKQLTIRNLFFFIYLADGFVLLFTKDSIGDKIANTVVTKK